MRRASLAALILAGTTGGPVLAQGLEGSLLTATISERFELDDNYDLDDPSPGTSYFADTRLELGFLNETDTQTFELGIDTGLRALWQAEEDFAFEVASPSTGTLAYVNEWASGLFDATLDYRQRRVDFIEAIDDTDTPLPDDLDQLEGDSRELRYDADIGVAFATNSPSSYALRFLGTQINYTEETPSQVARTTLEGQASWTLQLNPVLSSIVLGDYLYYEAQNPGETELTLAEIDAGVVYEPSANLLIRAGLGYADRQRKDTNPNTGVRSTTESNNGPTIRGDFRYVTDELVFTGNGRLSAAAPTTRFNGALRAAYTLPRGSIVGRVFQNYTGTSSGDEEARVTGAGIGIIRDLNNVSRIGLDFAVANQVDVDDGPDPAEPDINRVNVTATYSRDITAVVSADIGYRYRSRDEDPTNAASNAVFFQIGRTFETRP